MGSNFTWAEAVRKVLEEATEPMHYTDIAQEIVDRKLRYRFGATPPTPSRLSSRLKCRMR